MSSSRAPTSSELALSASIHALLLAPAPVLARSITAQGLACALLLITLSVLEARESRPCPKSTQARVETPLNVASGVSLLAIGWLSVAGQGGSWTGAFVAASGIALRVLAIRTLGEAFTSAIAPSAGALTETGIYGWVRHPSELGLLAIGAGLALLGGSPAAAVAFGCALLPSSVLRIRWEEQALSATFGDRHRVYRHRTGRLFPRPSSLLDRRPPARDLF